MEKFLYDDQFCQGHAEADKREVLSNRNACRVQKLGKII